MGQGAAPVIMILESTKVTPGIVDQEEGQPVVVVRDLLWPSTGETGINPS